MQRLDVTQLHAAEERNQVRVEAALVNEVAALPNLRGLFINPEPHLAVFAERLVTGDVNPGVHGELDL